MELRDITCMDELSELVYASSFDAFYQKIVEENRKYDKEYYEAYKRLYLIPPKGQMRRMVFENWTVFRGVIRVWHLARGIKHSKDFYRKGPYFLEYEKSKYQFIQDESSDTRPFFDVAKDIYDNIEQYKALYELLEDEASKTVLMGVLVSRLTGDYSHLTDLASANPQYFDSDIIKAYSDEVVVDAGGYTGDTAEALLETAEAKGRIKRIYLYEPDRNNIERAKKNLSGSEVEIIFRRAGISDKRGSLFVTDSGSGSRIVADEQGMDRVDVVALDEDIDERVTFIKMDIEGSEKAALQGFRKHILEDAPTLAICVYHKLNDVWWVPRYVKSLRPEYKFYLRYYYQGRMGDTVVYCLPCREETVDTEIH